MARKKGDRATLSGTEREWIYQTWLLLNKNAAKTARYTNFCERTVSKVVKEIEAENRENPITREARAEAAARQVSRLQDKSNEIIDSITPEELTTQRIEIKDRHGKVVDIKHVGPRLGEKSLAIGVMIDKTKVASDVERILRDDQMTGQLMLPDEAQGLIAGIKSQIKSLKILKVDFTDDHKELMTTAEDVVKEIERVEHEETVISDPDELYG